MRRYKKNKVLPFRQWLGMDVSLRRSLTCGYEDVVFQTIGFADFQFRQLLCIDVSLRRSLTCGYEDVVFQIIGFADFQFRQLLCIDVSFRRSLTCGTSSSLRRARVNVTLS
ncbi:MAG: hypothetical protein LBS16_06670 [Prevotellaceae bacterium]|nr:hypothetical protein [Prevotellaceae bacterium]